MYPAALIVSVFQSTRPREARPPFVHVSTSILPFQSTRPREARHAGTGNPAVTEWISIHAPARGATLGRYLTSVSPLFQSTRPREARQSGHHRRKGTVGFQSTRPREARLFPTSLKLLYTLFQSTRPREARLDVVRRSSFVHRFQSTRPREARPLSAGLYHLLNNFNPRARERRDLLQLKYHP